MFSSLAGLIDYGMPNFEEICLNENSRISDRGWFELFCTLFKYSAHSYKNINI